MPPPLPSPLNRHTMLQAMKNVVNNVYVQYVLRSMAANTEKRGSMFGAYNSYHQNQQNS